MNDWLKKLFKRYDTAVVKGVECIVVSTFDLPNSKAPSCRFCPHFSYDDGCEVNVAVCNKSLPSLVWAPVDKYALIRLQK